MNTYLRSNDDFASNPLLMRNLRAEFRQLQQNKEFCGGAGVGEEQLVRCYRCATAFSGTSSGASTVPICCVVRSITPMRKLYLPGGSESS